MLILRMGCHFEGPVLERPLAPTANGPMPIRQCCADFFCAPVHRGVQGILVTKWIAACELGTRC